MKNYITNRSSSMIEIGGVIIRPSETGEMIVDKKEWENDSVKLWAKKGVIKILDKAPAEPSDENPAEDQGKLAEDQAKLIEDQGKLAEDQAKLIEDQGKLAKAGK